MDRSTLSGSQLAITSSSSWFWPLSPALLPGQAWLASQAFLFVELSQCLGWLTLPNNSEVRGRLRVFTHAIRSGRNLGL